MPLERLGIVLSGVVLVLLGWKLRQRILSRTAPTIPTFGSHFQLLQRQYSLPAHTKIVDLGCGSGSTLRRFVRIFDLQAVGYDYSFLPLVRGRLINRLSGLRNISLVHQDMFRLKDIDADYVYVFLIPSQMAAVESRLWSAIDRSQTTVIVHVFPLPKTSPDRIIKDAHGNPQFYIYERV